MPRVLALGAAMVLTAHAGLAFAQETPSAADLAQARPLLNEGFKLRAQGDLAGALEKFRAAHSLAETPISGAELGRAYLEVGKLVEAREAFLSVGRIPHRAAETDRSAAARSQSAQLAEQLRTRIPSVAVKVVGTPESVVSVTVDGEAIPVDALGSQRYLNPGMHRVEAIADGRRAESKFELAEGEARAVVLQLEAPAAPLAPTPPAAAAPVATSHGSVSTSDGSGRRVAGLVTGGVGVAAVVVGGILALVAKSQDDSAANETFPAKHDDSLAASHMSDAATVLVATGAGVAVLGGLLWLTAPRAQVAVGTSGSALWLRGTF